MTGKKRVPTCAQSDLGQRHPPRRVIPSAYRSTLDNNDVVVMDIGSGVSKVGLSSESAPLSVFPSMFSSISGSVGWNAQAGDDADEIFQSYPVQRGMIKDFDGITRIWSYGWV